jgi:hypothetical protein
LIVLLNHQKLVANIVRNYLFSILEKEPAEKILEIISHFYFILKKDESKLKQFIVTCCKNGWNEVVEAILESYPEGTLAGKNKKCTIQIAIENENVELLEMFCV